MLTQILFGVIYWRLVIRNLNVVTGKNYEFNCKYMTFWDFIFASLEVFGNYALATILFGFLIYFLGPKAWDYFLSSKIELERSNLDLIKNNKGNVFNRLHERKLDAYTELFSELVLTYQKFNDYTNPVKIVPKGMAYDDFCLQEKKEFIEVYRNLKICYYNSIILIPEEISEKIKSLFEKLNELFKDYQEFEFYSLHGVRDTNKLDIALKKQLDATNFIQTQFPKLLDEILTVFKKDILKHD
ncbi:hypothetical protein [Cecembia lonarensis]|uniref:Uncharacterized protein n=1 Tax=Cecembia lonarensis (strain CCUG 58316 / KCTC 22772 / LW9) TaxID=1225176 RepID=K1L7B8_CECL9|nr:hypothetical protein [Cecembia lonarensis]EKB48027.1 hypothetical protein B879_03349 [Cecembia lonarensis LW9]